MEIAILILFQAFTSICYGYDYLFAFGHKDYAGQNDVYVTTMEPANFYMYSQMTGNISVSLDGNETWKYVGKMYGQYEFRCNPNQLVDNYGFHIHSNVPIDVIVFSSGAWVNSYNVDGTTILPLTPQFTSFYYLPYTAYDYVIVVSLHVKTLAEIFENRTEIMTRTLNYGQTLYYNEMYPGMYVKSSHPVAVFQHSFRSFSQMPPSTSLGKFFILPPAFYGGHSSSHSHQLRILSTEYDNHVEIYQANLRTNFILSTNRTYFTYVKYEDRYTTVNCSKLCMVNQGLIGRENQLAKTSISIELIPPVDQFSSRPRRFTVAPTCNTRDAEGVCYYRYIELTIIANYERRANLLFNGSPITNQWYTVDNSAYGFTHMFLNHHFNESTVFSLNCEPFVVYLMGHEAIGSSSTKQSSFFYHLGAYDEYTVADSPCLTTTTTTSTTSTSTSIPTVTPPQTPSMDIAIDHIGAYNASNTVSNNCLYEYNVKFNQRAAEMTSQTRDLIGNQLCNDISNSDVLSIRANTEVTLNETQKEGSVSATYSIKFDTLVQLGKAASCSEEISNYLLKHDNWNNVLWEPVIECPSVSWSRDFVEFGRTWNCNDDFGGAQFQNDEGKTFATLQEPKYQVSVSGSFTSAQNVTEICLAAHNTDWDNAVNSVHDALSTRINANFTCNNTGIIVETSSSFLSQASPKTLIGTAYLYLKSRDWTTSSFNSFTTCGNEVAAFVSNTNNWPSPIFPNAGCGEVTQDTAFNTSNNWLCN